MTGFRRALNGELFALKRRRGPRLAALFVVLAVFLRLAWARWLPAAAGGSTQANFWPRFAEAAAFGLGLAELASLVLVGGLLPREIGLGAVRDPLTRRISRPAFALARALTALLCPLLLGATAVAAAAAGAAVLWDGGHVVSAPFLAEEEPGAREAFAAWLEAEGVRADQAAAWLHLVEDEGLEPAAAADRLGLPPAFTIPDEYYASVPILVFLEEEVAGGILAALRQAVAPLVALGLFAFLLSLLLPTGALAAGLGALLVVLFSLFLAPELGETAGRVFADWLPGIGHDSALQIARRVADGFTDTVAPDPGRIAAGQTACWLEAAILFLAAPCLLPRRRL
ncbi:MAG: hypothetical protein D6702_12105 [Planctomycetota bacterium]|nr:MAG: hypothetical protein D6702_12105 [Planctomycetota bacterium]